MPNKIETKERMLKMKEVLWNYVTTNYSKERYYSFLYANALHLLFEEELFPYMSDDEKIQHSNMKENNLKKELLRFCEIKHIVEILSSAGITPIFFKGYILIKMCEVLVIWIFMLINKAFSRRLIY